MELNNLKIENPELLIQMLIKQVQEQDNTIKILEFRLANIQYILTTKVEKQNLGKISDKEEGKEEDSTDIENKTIEIESNE